MIALMLAVSCRKVIQIYMIQNNKYNVMKLKRGIRRRSEGEYKDLLVFLKEIKLFCRI